MQTTVTKTYSKRPRAVRSRLATLDRYLAALHDRVREKTHLLVSWQRVIDEQTAAGMPPSAFRIMKDIMGETQTYVNEMLSEMVALHRQRVECRVLLA